MEYLLRTGLLSSESTPKQIKTFLDGEGSPATGRSKTPSTGTARKQRNSGDFADEILGGTTVLEGRLALPPAQVSATVVGAAGADVVQLDQDEAAPNSQQMSSANQRPIELASGLTGDSMLERWQAVRASSERKKAFVTAQVIDIKQLHKPPGPRMYRGSKLPSLLAYEIREIFEQYVLLQMDRRRYFNSTNVLPGIAIPFNKATHKLITDMELVRRSWKTMDFIVIGGCHSREATARLHKENPSTPEFTVMQCYIYVALNEEEARQVTINQYASLLF